MTPVNTNFGSGEKVLTLPRCIGVGAAAAEAAMAAPLFARNNVSSMASEVAEPPHFLLPY